MDSKIHEHIIIGAGLTGLTVAYLLKKKGIAALVLEARDRIGGRILTRYKENEPPIEMGATWLGQKHQSLNNLLNDLGIEIRAQVLGQTAIYEPISTSPHQIVQLPPNTDPSFRICGGSSVLIDTLAGFLDATQIQLKQAVDSIQLEEETILINTTGNQFRAKKVISTLPPFLLAQSIDFSPVLPKEFLQIAKQTHTWMGESIKVGLSYKTPFWREGKLSGTIVSNVGPIPEMYDHSNEADTHFALKGFLNGAYFSATKEERKQIVLRQLNKYFGPIANDYLSYEEAVWRTEKYTFQPYLNSLLPHQNNGNATFRKPFFDGRFIVAGAETAPSFPGYMDGAVQSANLVLEQLSS